MNKKLQIFYCLCLCILSTVNSYCQLAETTLREAKQLYEQNNYPLAQEKYLEALKQAEEQNNQAAMARASLSIAKCHYFLYDHTASFKWSYNAMQIAKKNNLDTLLSQAYYFLGVLYIEAKKIDSADKYSFKAIELMLKENDYARLSQTYSTLAELHLNTSKNPAKIEKMIAEAEKYAELSNDEGMMAFAASKRFNYYFYLIKDYDKALKYVNKEEELYLKTGNREAILNAYRAKAECLVMLRDTSARTYMWKWFHFKDSVLQSEKAVNIAKYETLYDTEKKENENKLLKEKHEQNKLILLVVVVVFLLLIALGLWLINRNNLKIKQNELIILQNLQKDKERIARDLHDNIGGQLSYIIYSLDGINDEGKEKRREITESISQSVKIVISSLRETIWAISDANIKIQDFSDKLKVFARNLFKHSNTKIHYIESIKKQREFEALLGLNLYRICQEILNNAFKYAAASEVKIEMYSQDEKLMIIINDNGVGFDVNEKNKEQYGLQNIKKRAVEFGISLTLETEINKGTTYKLLV